MKRARTWGLAKTPRYDGTSSDLGPSSPHQSCPDCIIATRGYDFREGQERCCTSKCSASPLSPSMSRPNLLAPRSPRSSCWERCTLVRRSRPRSPTGCGDGRCGMDRDDISNRDGCSYGRSIDAEEKEPLDMNDMLDPNNMPD